MKRPVEIRRLRRGAVELPCGWCGARVRRRASHVAARTYCSPACKVAAQRADRTFSTGGTR